MLRWIAWGWLLVGLPSLGYGWGERGHDLSTRIAARLIIASDRSGKGMSVPLIAKEHWLGHLSNAPDFYWRNPDAIGKAATKLNAPTHYVDLEYLALDPKIDNLPRTVKAAEAAIKRLCTAKAKLYVCPKDGATKPDISKAGSSPWRIHQFHSLIVAELKKAKAAKPKSKEFTEAVNNALLYAGLQSHFVSDLANPHHTTRDYDGWEINQGGVHRFFESDVVNRFTLELDARVMKMALKERPHRRVLQRLPLKQRKEMAQSAILLSYALALDSFSRLKQLNELDKKYAVTRPSSKKDGLKVPAERRPPVTVAKHFYTFATDRLATAASMVGQFWSLAWTQAGKPDLSSYQSYHYVVAPEFIKPDFL